MATRAYFGFPRVTEQFATLSGGSWLATYPLLQLQRLPLSYVARTLDAATSSSVIIATASSPQICSTIALVGHNLSQNAQIRLYVWADAAEATLLFDSGIEDVWAASYTTAELEGAVWTWERRFSFPATLTSQRIRINITDTSNPDGYIQAGFLEIAAAFDVSYNFEPGSQYGFRWRSLAGEAIGGAKYVDDRVHPRVFKGNFPFTLRSESMGKFYEMQRQHRMHLPLLFVPWPTETTHFMRTVMFAHQLDPGLSTMRFVSNLGLIDGVPLSLEEIVG